MLLACSRNSKEANMTGAESSKEESEGDEAFKVTGNGYRSCRTSKAMAGTLDSPQMIRGATASVRVDK